MRYINNVCDGCGKVFEEGDDEENCKTESHNHSAGLSDKGASPRFVDCGHAKPDLENAMKETTAA